MEDEKKRRFKNVTWASQRNLHQYKNLTDDEFEERMLQREMGINRSAEFEQRIEGKIKIFKEDYDLDDMNMNDKVILRNLVQSMIMLEDIEITMFNSRVADGGITGGNISLLEKLGKMASDLRADISKMQDDLKITRRVRKSDKELSAVAYLQNLQQKAKEFYEAKMMYVYCNKCNTLLGTVWCLYPEAKESRLHFHCRKKLENGSLCNNVVKLTTAELFEMRGNNTKNVPEAIQ
jgi:hypothetical protein